MKTKLLNLAVGAAIVCTLSVSGEEYGYFSKTGGATEWPAPNTVTLHDGDRMVVLHSQRTNTDLKMTDRHGVIHNIDMELLCVYISTVGVSSQSLEQRTLVGPATITPAAYSGSAYISYKIIRASDNSIKPTNVISLPADPDGDMQLVFESSDDLLTWYQEFSFTHNSTNQSSRFFRTRLIQGAGE